MTTEQATISAALASDLSAMYECSWWLHKSKTEGCVMTSACARLSCGAPVLARSLEPAVLVTAIVKHMEVGYFVLACLGRG